MNLSTENKLRGGVASRVDSGGTAADRVYEDLRTRILEFDLPPDATLSRNDLAKAYGVSQTPVREALQRLEEDGLIRIYPQSKTVVARIDEDQLKETHFLRVAIETEVVRRVALAGDAAVVKRARSYVRMQEALMDDPSQMALFYELDRGFHATLFEAVGMIPLYRMLARRLGHLARCQRLELPRSGKLSEIVHGHMAVVEGLASGDPELAAAAMRGHIGATIRRVTLLREEFPDYFEGAAA
ncbi:GntR family transcriptional regulator [Psychromarinibacter sp. C21-152]|uniref:GntR family transcriptional regulator n=1 Tax=Psychromarinibacter sediminicola TaxID=3033385 RepID=A0AAE3NTW0_9RHOB|nr:GntR family transcriptional regulator [Psychromarinibacter sediminicola]MDF0601962.1 GntR family transcriptional regulator [Psychromarinibacter sediminicola]